MIKRERARKTGVALGVAVVAALGAGGAAIAQAGGGEEAENSVTGPRAEQARAAALRITNGGTANSVERDSENGATWEVEVTRPDGKTVDVRLDQRYKLVVVEGDSESPDTKG
jgi:hypothetical protein